MARAYALQQRLPSGNQIHAALRLPQAAGPGDARGGSWPKLSTLTSGKQAHVPILWKPTRDSRL